MTGQVQSRFSRRTIMLVSILILILIALGITGYLYYARQLARIRQTKQDELAAIADLKVSQIVQWRKERLDDAQLTMHNRPLARGVQQLETDPAAASARADVLAWMSSLQKTTDYESIFILDTNGRLLLSLSKNDAAALDSFTVNLARQVALSKTPGLSDLHVTEDIDIEVAVPLLIGQGNDSSPTGVIVMRVDPYTFLYPLIQSWPTPSHTGETLLVRREGDEVVYLNELRHRNNTALSLRLPLGDPDLPAALAVRGQEGIVEGIDYRGVPVLADLRTIPGSPWFIVTKVDQVEVDEQANELGTYAMGMGLALMLVAGAGVGLLWRQDRVAYYRELYENEVERQEMTQQLDFLSRYANDAILLMDDQGRILQSNDRALVTYGYSLEQLHQMNIRDLRTPEFHARLDEELKRAVGEKGSVFETVHRRKDGSTFPAEISARIIEFDGKSFNQEIIRDITERKQAEEEQQKLIMLVESSSDFIGIASLDGQVLYMNRAGQQLVGLEASQVQTKTIFDFLPPEDLPAVQEQVLRAVMQTGHWAGELRFRHFETGQAIPVEMHGFVVPDAKTGKPLALGTVIRNITERKRTEEALRQAELRYRTLFEQSPDGVVIIDPETALPLEFNAAAPRQLGYSREEFATLRIRDYSVVEELEGKHARVEKIRREGRDTFETLHRTKQGEIRNVFVTVQRIELASRPVLHAIFRDITERKQAVEGLQKYAAQLERSNRELQDFAFVASHDLQEPLRKIQAFSDRLESKYAKSLNDEGRDYMERMRNAAGRMSAMINGLLAYSRVTTKAEPFVPVDLTQEAREVVSDLEVRIEQTHGRVDIGALPTIDADHLQMQQLLQNLIANALKFHREGEPPVVRVYGKQIQERRGAGDSSSGELCQIIVEDNGIGFDEKYLNRIFQPFQRLHGRSEYEGTGMGLAICRKIIERHGGSITAKSTPGQGATFIVTLPVSHSGMENK